jgi:hypothetical protein
MFFSASMLFLFLSIMEKIFKTLKFNDKAISLIMADGSWYVAVKPICEALNVNYEKQRERISRHPILSQLPTKQVVVAADGKLRDMLCLPEKYIYGWLFSINSDSLDLIEYQEKCYEVLYNHFHGQLTFRYNVLCEKKETIAEIEALETKLKNSPEMQRIAELKNKKKNCDKSLEAWDTDLLVGQMRMELN